MMRPYSQENFVPRNSDPAAHPAPPAVTINVEKKLPVFHSGSLRNIAKDESLCPLDKIMLLKFICKKIVDSDVTFEYTPAKLHEDIQITYNYMHISLGGCIVRCQKTPNSDSTSTFKNKLFGSEEWRSNSPPLGGAIKGDDEASKNNFVRAFYTCNKIEKLLQDVDNQLKEEEEEKTEGLEQKIAAAESAKSYFEQKRDSAQSRSQSAPPAFGLNHLKDIKGRTAASPQRFSAPPALSNEILRPAYGSTAHTRLIQEQAGPTSFFGKCCYKLTSCFSPGATTA